MAITHIFQLSDIHIRNDRYEEYRLVFEKVIDSIKSTKLLYDCGLIVLCGDIMHDKEKLTSEQIMITRNFLYNLSQIHRVIVIAGNHDMIMNNKDKLDNIYPVVDRLSNVHYLDKSKLYTFENVVFGLCSIDGSIPKIKKINGKCYIALYHGTLKEVMYSEKALSLKDFNQYDYTMLGDIHEYKELDETCIYPGSLIQQTFGESINKHGYVLWNIREYSHQFVEIVNDYGLCCIRFNNNEPNIPIPLVKHLSFKLVLKNSKQQECIKYIEDECNRNNINIVKIIIKQENDEDDETGEAKFDMSKQEELAFISEIVKDDNVLELHKKYTSLEQDIKTLPRWKLKKLVFKNVLIFGNDIENTIDFEDKKGCTGILGNNAIGKTSIINIILFILFSKSSFHKVNTFINNRANKFYIKAIITIGSTDYIIENVGTRRSNEKVQSNISYTMIKDGISTNLSKEDRIKTSNYISSCIGSYDDFILTNAISIREDNSLLNMAPAKIKEALHKLLLLDSYKDYVDSAKEELAHLEGHQQFLNGQLISISLTNVEKIDDTQLTALKDTYTSLTSEIEQLKRDIDLLEFDRSLLNKQVIYEECYDDINELINSIDFNEKEIHRLRSDNSLETILTRIDVNLHRIATLEDNKKRLNVSDEQISIEEEQLIKMRIELSQLTLTEVKVSVKETDINNKRKKLDTLIKNKKKFNIFDDTYVEDIDNKLISDNNTLLELKTQIGKLTYVEIDEDIDVKTKRRNTILETKTHIKVLNEFEIDDIEKQINEANEILLNTLIQLNTLTFTEIVENKKTIKDRLRENEHELSKIGDIIDDDLSIDIKLVFNKRCKLCKQNKEFFINERHCDEETYDRSIKEYLLGNNIRYKELKKRIDEDKLLLSQLEQNEQYIKLENTVAKLKNDIGVNQSIIKDNKEYIKQLLSLEKDLNVLERDIEQIKQNKQYKSIEKKINIIQKTIQDNTNLLKKNKENVKNINIIDKEIDELKQSISNDEDILKQLNQNKQYKKIQKALQDKQDYIKQIKQFKTQLNDIDEEIKLLEHLINDDQHIIKQIEEYNKLSTINQHLKHNLENAKLTKEMKIVNEFRNLTEVISKKTTERDGIYKQICKLENDIENTTKIIERNKAKKTKFDELKKELDEIEFNISIHQKYIEFFKYDNIPYKILLKFIPRLESSANKFLSKHVDFKISIESTDDINIYMIKDDNKIFAKVCSGFERFMIDLALKIALSNISRLSRPNFMCADEGWDVFDENNIKKIPDILNHINNIYDFTLIISHVETLKQYMTDNIVISHDGNNSHIV